MHVKLNSIYAGPYGCYQPGSIIEVNKDQGKALVEGGYAVNVTPAAAEKPAHTKAKSRAERESGEKAVEHACAEVERLKADHVAATRAWEQAEPGEAKAQALAALEKVSADAEAADKALQEAVSAAA